MAKRVKVAGAPTARELEWHRVLAEQERSGLSVVELPSFELTLTEGCSVRVPAHFDEDGLRRLLAVLRASC